MKSCSLFSGSYTLHPERRFSTRLAKKPSIMLAIYRPRLEVETEVFRHFSEGGGVCAKEKKEGSGESL